MINQQLVEYIKQQTQAGVSKDAIRKALMDAGWPSADVEDSLTSAVSAAGPSATPGSVRATINPAVAMGGTDTGAASSVDMSPKSSSGEKFFAKSSSMKASDPVEIDEDDEHPAAKKFMMTVAAMGAVIIILAASLIFVYFNLSGQLSAMEQSGVGGSGQMTTLETQMAQLTAEKNDLMTQLGSATTMNAELAAELSFLVATPAPAGSSSTAPAGPTSVNIRGLLTGTGATAPFTLTTTHNVKVYVLNYKDPKVQAALTPLTNGTSTVTLTGTHTIGSPNLTVTAVNGTAL